ncbi:Txe/YoeB family addiction module toxin [bacterium]|nr:Txe/YoeB family addiction module toxin [FCB group bacterium]MBL7191978.1 Txe/YoeB family addiction module toxin [bacterium]
MKVSFTDDSFDEFNYWAETDRKVYRKIVKIIHDIARSPFDGLGKPEPLRYNYPGCWSRRITDEHRLIYQIIEDEIIIISCRYHY